MVESRGKKGSISEEDVCALLQRYPAATILAVLREVAQAVQSPEVNIDWDGVMSKLNNAGIKSPRELHLLWRHLAYRLPLSVQPLEDDSDLEFEVEVFPPVSAEATADAVNCVRVLASIEANEPTLPNSATVELDMPNGSSKSSLENPAAASLLPNSNGPLPLSSQVEGLDANGAAHPRKKRKWSEEEDLKLIAGVQKWGEGNWAAMLKEDGSWGRTAGQLSQRWGNMKRKQGNLSAGTGSTGPQLSEAQLATRRAIDMALKDNLIAGNGAAAATNKSAQPNTSNGESPVNTMVLSQKPVAQGTNTSVKQASNLPKFRPSLKKAPPKAPDVSDPIQAAAVAAGARIATDSVAVALREQVDKTMFPNVHYIRTGLGPTAASLVAGTASLPNGAQQDKGKAGMPSVVSPAVSHLPRAKSLPAVAPERINVSNSSSDDELKKQVDKTSTKVNVGDSVRKSTVGVQENNPSLRTVSKKLPEKNHSASGGVSEGALQLTAAIGNSQHATSKGIALSEHKDEISKMDVSENVSAVEVSVTPNVNGRHELKQSSVVDGAEKMEVSG